LAVALGQGGMAALCVCRMAQRLVAISRVPRKRHALPATPSASRRSRFQCGIGGRGVIDQDGWARGSLVGVLVLAAPPSPLGLVISPSTSAQQIAPTRPKTARRAMANRGRHYIHPYHSTYVHTYIVVLWYIHLQPVAFAIRLLTVLQYYPLYLPSTLDPRSLQAVSTWSAWPTRPMAPVKADGWGECLLYVLPMYAAACAHPRADGLPPPTRRLYSTMTVGRLCRYLR